MQLRNVGSISLFLVMAASFSSGQTQSGSGTGIEGVITFSPTQPGPIRADAPSSKPLANATFVVENEKRVEVASFTTDDQGRFRVPLAPGHYTVSKKGTKSSIGRYGPWDVDVRADQLTRVTWECDTGVR
jgi:Carboxypeptidase regulatory-like domain